MCVRHIGSRIPAKWAALGFLEQVGRVCPLITGIPSPAVCQSVGLSLSVLSFAERRQRGRRLGTLPDRCRHVRMTVIVAGADKRMLYILFYR